ncbi:hypothetical protein B0181_06430 [Moraxella caviae]|uniref:Protein of uncharacterized function (DUF3025) n=1 Tax=Moraxella caviae TaxID=34060 RepID=A0A1T0A1G3_9GAMM|nr:DUF3025 domain-containing protein [Moraxella caviae]OOR89602.1 hypothetical protein B0181_06430 [Moraxella caviae]STZ10286.1 Protein of uncharacterised function (DUF3025) [Moraxella caviae]
MAGDCGDFISQFATINTDAPWLFHLADLHRSFADAAAQASDDERLTLAGALYEWLNAYFAKNAITLYGHAVSGCSVNHNAKQRLTFTHQNDLPHGVAYEKFIGEHQQIPTRNNLHDWFGACIWAKFPKSKAVLNAKHITHLHDDDSGNKRNRVRDTITVFDENGAVVVVADDDVGKAIADGLRRFDWQTCLVQHRAQWADFSTPNPKAQAFIFGHALLEQLVHPRKSLCSHTLIISMPQEFFAAPLPVQLAMLDDALAAQLQQLLQDGVTPRELHPLPILGVPYFWDNADPQFYADTSVFRAGRRQDKQDKSV